MPYKYFEKLDKKRIIFTPSPSVAVLYQNFKLMG